MNCAVKVESNVHSSECANFSTRDVLIVADRLLEEVGTIELMQAVMCCQRDLTCRECWVRQE